MVLKCFPAAVAAVFVAPALAAAQAPTMQAGDVATQPVPEAVTAPQVAPPRAERTGREVTLLGMMIVPDRSDRPVIQSVEPGSPAARAGLREDDLIEGLGHVATPTMHEVLNSVIPLIRNLDPGTKLSWHINRDGREEIFSIPRPSDRDLGPVSDLEQRVIERQSGSPGYYSSLVVPAPPRPLPRPERHHVGHDVYADMQYSWWYDGDEMPGLVRQWVNRTIRSRVGPNQDYQYYWWYDGDGGMPQALTQWIQNAGVAQAGTQNPDLQYSWWYDGD
jgi:hypothetical protein